MGRGRLLRTSHRNVSRGQFVNAAVSEAERVAALYEHADPDAVQGADIDDIVADAAAVAGVLMATLNLIDADRQCPVSTLGFEGAPVPRREAMCNVTLELGQFVHVPDARTDPRFADSPWVDGRLGEVRFYASAPLITRDGFIIGTLCVFDVEPHELSPGQIAALTKLAARVVETFERDRLRLS
jgi:GAF domain-containing protein